MKDSTRCSSVNLKQRRDAAIAIMQRAMDKGNRFYLEMCRQQLDTVLTHKNSH